MTPSFVDYGDRIAFANDDGSHVVYKQITRDGAGNILGPGYIARIIWRAADGTISGKRPSDGWMAEHTSPNDPNCQGILLAGWHHYRDIPGETNIWNKGWDFGGARDGQTSDPFGVRDCNVLVPPYSDANGYIRASFLVNFVDRYSAAESKRVMSVRYDYIVEPSDVKVWATFTEFPDGADSGPAAYLKEPKYVVGIGGSSYTPTTLAIYDSANTVLTSIDLVNDPRLQNPGASTVQIGFDQRYRAAFRDGIDYFDVVAEGNSLETIDPTTYKVTNYGSRVAWENGGQGLDAFASDANLRAHFDDSVCAAYCLQGPGGTLTRQWEVAKRGGDPRTEIMLHGWEGGSGLPDCLCCARVFVPGRKWTNFFSLSRNSGWVL